MTGAPVELQKNFTSVLYWQKSNFALVVIPVVVSLKDGQLRLRSKERLEYDGPVQDAKIEFKRSKLIEMLTLTVTVPGQKPYSFGRIPSPLSPSLSKEQVLELQAQPAPNSTAQTAAVGAGAVAASAAGLDVLSVAGKFAAADMAMSSMEDNFQLLNTWQTVFINNNVTFTPIDLSFNRRKYWKKLIIASLIMCGVIILVATIWYTLAIAIPYWDLYG